jgi:CopG family nickel-responsive transcriptional regulator
MQRITVTIDDELLAAIDKAIAGRGYQNRSEAIRDLVRAGMAELEERAPVDHEGVAALLYVYDHEGRELAKRLTRASHDHHDLSLATMHVHLDHESCLEVAVLRGAMNEIRHFAERVIAERGVRHGKLVAVPVEVETASHSHGGRGHRHLHTHVREAG